MIKNTQQDSDLSPSPILKHKQSNQEQLSIQNFANQLVVYDQLDEKSVSFSQGQVKIRSSSEEALFKQKQQTKEEIKALRQILHKLPKHFQKLDESEEGGAFMTQFENQPDFKKEFKQDVRKNSNTILESKLVKCLQFMGISDQRMLDHFNEGFEKALTKFTIQQKEEEEYALNLAIADSLKTEVDIYVQRFDPTNKVGFGQSKKKIISRAIALNPIPPPSNDLKRIKIQKFTEDEMQIMCSYKIQKERKEWQMILKNKQPKFPYQQKIENQFQERTVEFRQQQKLLAQFYKNKSHFVHRRIMDKLEQEKIQKGLIESKLLNEFGSQDSLEQKLVQKDPEGFVNEQFGKMTVEDINYYLNQSMQLFQYQNQIQDEQNETLLPSYKERQAFMLGLKKRWMMQRGYCSQFEKEHIKKVKRARTASKSRENLRMRYERRKIIQNLLKVQKKSKDDLENELDSSQIIFQKWLDDQKLRETSPKSTKSISKMKGEIRILDGLFKDYQNKKNSEFHLTPKTKQEKAFLKQFGLLNQSSSHDLIGSGGMTKNNQFYLQGIKKYVSTNRNSTRNISRYQVETKEVCVGDTLEKISPKSALNEWKQHVSGETLVDDGLEDLMYLSNGVRNKVRHATQEQLLQNLKNDMELLDQIIPNNISFKNQTIENLEVQTETVNLMHNKNIKLETDKLGQNLLMGDEKLLDDQDVNASIDGGKKAIYTHESIEGSTINKQTGKHENTTHSQRDQKTIAKLKKVITSKGTGPSFKDIEEENMQNEKKKKALSHSNLSPKGKKELAGQIGGTRNIFYIAQDLAKEFEVERNQVSLPKCNSIPEKIVVRIQREDDLTSRGQYGHFPFSSASLNEEMFKSIPQEDIQQRAIGVSPPQLKVQEIVINQQATNTNAYKSRQLSAITYAQRQKSRQNMIKQKKKEFLQELKSQKKHTFIPYQSNKVDSFQLSCQSVIPDNNKQKKVQQKIPVAQEFNLIDQGGFLETDPSIKKNIDENKVLQTVSTYVKQAGISTKQDVDNIYIVKQYNKDEILSDLDYQSSENKPQGETNKVFSKIFQSENSQQEGQKRILFLKNSQFDHTDKKMITGSSRSQKYINRDLIPDQDFQTAEAGVTHFDNYEQVIIAKTQMKPSTERETNLIEKIFNKKTPTLDQIIQAKQKVIMQQNQKIFQPSFLKQDETSNERKPRSTSGERPQNLMAHQLINQVLGIEDKRIAIAKVQEEQKEIIKRSQQQSKATNYKEHPIFRKQEPQRQQIPSSFTPLIQQAVINIKTSKKDKKTQDNLTQQQAIDLKLLEIHRQVSTGIITQINAENPNEIENRKSMGNFVKTLRMSPSALNSNNAVSDSISGSNLRVFDPMINPHEVVLKQNSDCYLELLQVENSQENIKEINMQFPKFQESESQNYQKKFVLSGQNSMDSPIYTDAFSPYNRENNFNEQCDVVNFENQNTLIYKN